MGEFSLGVYLSLCGLSIEDVEMVNLNPSGIVKAMIDGKIDAALTWEPNIYNIQKRLRGETIILPAQIEDRFYFILICKDGWIKSNPATVGRLLRALVQAERYVKDNREKVEEIAKNRFHSDLDYVKYILPKNTFFVGLPQTLLIRMEDQARWRIKNNLTTAQEVPNYLDCIYTDALENVKPEGLTIFR